MKTMRQILILVLFFITSTLISTGQALISHFEVWGYNGPKQEFVEKYKKEAGVDLNKESYCCMSTLFKMGYKSPFAAVYPNGSLGMITGKIDYELADRLVVVRPIADSKYAKMASDIKWQKDNASLFSEFYYKDIKAKNQFITKNSTKFKEFLIGTLIPYEKMGIRNECNNLHLRDIDFNTVNLTSTELEILSSMLSFPDPNTCYSAMRILSQKKIKNKEVVLKEHAETLKDFLRSNFMTFRKDAIKFLVEIEPSGKDWSYQKWIKWIENGGLPELSYTLE